MKKKRLKMALNWFLININLVYTITYKTIKVFTIRNCTRKLIQVTNYKYSL